jgi:DHA2 family multidrug resistance protein
MRNIGGSMGIAASTTMLARYGQVYTNQLGARVTPYDPAAQSMFQGLRDAFVARGADLVTATQRAQAAMFGLVSRQATMLAFVTVFRTLALIFILMLPLVLVMKSPRGRGPVEGAH